MTHTHASPMQGTLVAMNKLTNISRLSLLLTMGALITISALIATPSTAHARKMVFEPNNVKHISYFPQTDYPLDVYIITGTKPGATGLIVGGIQGDEEGGYLAADQFIDMKVDTGTLIVIPRANAKAVAIAERATVVDMNRQFKNITYEKMRGAIETIKKYISEADVFINFHDGWGFHRKEYTDWSYSPDRFGQSVVTDSDEYTCSNDTILNLREPAFMAIKSANERIQLEKYYLEYFNTRTFEETSKYYTSMTNASTYYVLTAECKPAFAIEASKNLPTVRDKVLVHVYAAIPLLAYYGIIVNESVSPVVAPTMSHVVVDVDGTKYALQSGQTINVTQGSTVTVKNIYGNYQRGYTVDIIGVDAKGGRGQLDTNTPHVMSERGKVVANVYKDSVSVGKVFFQVQAPVQTPVPRGGGETLYTGLATPTTPSLLASVNGQIGVYPVAQNIVLNKGDAFTPIYFLLPKTDVPYFVNIINIKGFVPKGLASGINTGNDMGHTMVAGVSDMLTQYAVRPTAGDNFGVGEVFPVVVEYTVANSVARNVEVFRIQILK